MQRTDVIILGAGQAGLAMGRCLAEQGIDHVLLERGRVAERWRQRWDSLRLLTPNWMSRLPGARYAGCDPDAYMSSADVVALLSRYAADYGAPVREHTRVRAVTSAIGGGYRVHTERGSLSAGQVVIATGACDRTVVPDFARALSSRLHQVTADRYRRPDDLPPGGVLVVGASATGVQLAEELHRTGRRVTLAVGEHTRVPRRYRGRDIFWWLDRIGALDRGGGKRRHEPSLQLVGRDDGRDIDLQSLQAMGVRLVGRVTDAQGDRVQLGDDLRRHAALADARLCRLLDRIDDFAGREGLGSPRAPRALRPLPFAPGASPRRLHLPDAGIRSVLWATGFRPSYPWLQVPVLDARGRLRQRGGVTTAPGLYALGLPAMRTRRSTYLDGVGADAQALTAHISARLRGRSSRAA